MAAGGFRIPEDMPALIEAGGRHAAAVTGPPLGQEWRRLRVGLRDTTPCGTIPEGH